MPKSTGDHVIPANLYPPGYDPSVRRLKVRSCRQCNSGFSEDEVHFRNVLSLIGDRPNAPRVQVWRQKVSPSLRRGDGQRRLADLWAILRPELDSDRLRIYPGEDERFLRIAAKVIRGLHFFHTSRVAEEDLVIVRMASKPVPEEVLLQTSPHTRGKDIIEYRFDAREGDPYFQSLWALTFYETIVFTGGVFQPGMSINDLPPTSPAN